MLLGSLYGLGAAVEARRLARAHVSIADVLPVVPLPHLLAEGIGLLIESLLILGVTTLVVVGLIQLEKRLDPYLESRKLRQRTIRSRTAAIWGEIRQLQAESAALAKTAEDGRRVIANPPKVEPPKTQAERAAVLKLSAEMNQLLEDTRNYEPRIQDLDKRTKALARRHKRYIWQVRLGNLPFKVFARSLRWGPLTLAVVGSLFVTPILAASFLTGALVWSTHRHTQIRSLLLILYCIVAVGFLTDRIIRVPPLPVAHVTTANRSYEGTLALMTDSTWYVAAAGRAVLPIPASRNVEGSYVSAPSNHFKTVADLIEAAF